MSGSVPLAAPGGAVRDALEDRPFRRLWFSYSLSSLGGWLALLALLSLAFTLSQGHQPFSPEAAVAGVLGAKLAARLLLPALLRLATDRVDSRLVMAVADAVRVALFVSVPLVATVEWVLAVAFLSECAAVARAQATNSALAGLVADNRQDRARRFLHLTPHGTAPLAAAVFAVLAVAGWLLEGLFSPMADVALYANTVAFAAAGVLLWWVPSAARESQESREDEETTQQAEGTRPIPTLRERTRTAVVPAARRWLAWGMLAVFVPGGLLVGAGRVHVSHLGAGDAGFGVLVAAVTTGTALGVFGGSRLLRDVSRERLFGLAAGLAGASLIVVGLVGDMAVAAVFAALTGLGAGLAWSAGTVLLARQSDEEDHERVLDFLHPALRFVLVASAIVAPLLAWPVGDHQVRSGDVGYGLWGTGVVLAGAGLVAHVAAAVCYRRMTRGLQGSLRAEVATVLRGAPAAPPVSTEQLPGTFIVFEGGEGAGKSTQARQLSVWLRDEGFEVVSTREPGATKLGMRLRTLLLERGDTPMSPRAEALLYAADRANHVQSVILPALRRGAIVISDRYVDSTLAYQGAGRELSRAGMERINDWATEELVPHLTVLLDVPPEEGLARNSGEHDRIESESEEFHTQVRAGFRDLAARDPGRYLVLDARDGEAEIFREVRRRVRRILPDPVPRESEAVTGMMPIIDE
ncbi:thymidylate kinase [Haloactinospora alba]|uniref:Thymidylate kinase n=1 Tax=Haloactinospora alba TaxID=405555 RepID=A0A543NN27_9ACTN|nr:dTMP kinase [Haloactinospora alba]TQN33197.1 thymidylate kinase [Haloactinospora alba]